MIVIRARIIPRISGRVVIKTVINATHVGGREIGRYLCARSALVRDEKKDPLKTDNDLQQQNCILIKDIRTKNKEIS